MDSTDIAFICMARESMRAAGKEPGAPTMTNKLITTLSDETLEWLDKIKEPFELSLKRDVGVDCKETKYKLTHQGGRISIDGQALVEIDANDEYLLRDIKDAVEAFEQEMFDILIRHRLIVQCPECHNWVDVDSMSRSEDRCDGCIEAEQIASDQQFDWATTRGVPR